MQQLLLDNMRPFSAFVFWRCSTHAAKPSRSSYMGTGLGMPIVKNLTELMGGHHRTVRDARSLID